MKPMLFTLGRNNELAGEISKKLGIELSDAIITKFDDGESFARSNVDVEGRDVVVIHSVSRPVNKTLMELLIFLDALHNGGAKKLTVVIPYFGYSRQDRQKLKGDPITGHLVVRLLKAAYADEIICVDYHSKELFEKLDIKKTDITALPLLAEAVKNYLENKGVDENICCVSPDKGGIERAKLFAQTFENSSFAYATKYRPRANSVVLEQLYGDVKDKNCIVIDDICDTGGTLINVVKALREKGAKSVYIAVTHGVFSGDAIANLNNAPIDGFFVTNSIENEEFKKLKYINIISISSVLSEVISIK